MNNKLYPLQFKEVIRNYDYGDRNIAQLYPDKDLPEEEIIAETWEVTAHPDDSGRVINGPLRGKTLRGLVGKFGPQLVGKDAYQRYGEKFPLLPKLLDVEQTLEVQIHPKDKYAKENKLDELGKPEAWYILDAEPGVTLYWGTNEGVTKRDLQEIGPDERKMRDLLMEIPVKEGDVLYLPPGRVHAIRKDIVLFEIQQTSDVTIGPDYLFLSGKQVDEVRPEEAFEMFLDQISIENIGPKEATIPGISFPKGKNKLSYLLATKYFALEKVELNKELVLSRDPGRKFSIFTSLEGVISIGTKNFETRLYPGQTALIPACLSEISLTPSNGGAKLLKSYIPNLKEDIVKPLRKQGFSESKIAHLGGFGKQNDLLPFLENGDL